MKKSLFIVLALSSLAFAFDMGSITDSIDTKAAMKAIDKDKMKEAAKSGDMKSMASAVDKDKLKKAKK